MPLEPRDGERPLPWPAPGTLGISLLPWPSPSSGGALRYGQFLAQPFVFSFGASQFCLRTLQLLLAMPQLLPQILILALQFSDPLGRMLFAATLHSKLR